MFAIVRRAALWSRCRAHLATAADGSNIDVHASFYTVLGVPEGTHDATVLRNAYLARARVLHPDASGGRSDDRSEFQRLQLAWWTLRSPERRKLYDLQLAEAAQRRRGIGARVRAAAAAATAVASEESPWASRLPPQVDALAKHAGLQRQLQRALASAYWGPSLSRHTLELGLLPPAYECDVRTPGLAGADKADVMHVVSGRTLLGIVRQERTAALHDEENTTAKIEVDSADELHLMCGQPQELAARAVRRIKDGRVDIFVRGCRTFGVTPAAVSGGSFGRSSIIDVASGEETHTLVRSTTPGVSHLHVFQGQPVALEDSSGLTATTARRHARCVLKATRPVLPPAALWLFPPRVDTHTVGGWYVESAPLESEEEAAADLRLIVTLLLALDTLDRERSQSAPGWGERLMRSLR